VTTAESSTKIVVGGVRGGPDVVALRQDRWWIQPVVTGASAGVGQAIARAFAAPSLSSIRAAVPSGEPRCQATVEAVANELAREGYVYRFQRDQQPLGEAEGAFVLCGFPMALAAHELGRSSDARFWFERSRSACGPPGLFREEFDVLEHQTRGNLPPTFVHATLLECASRLPLPPPRP
jgi:hypothetical protein